MVATAAKITVSAATKPMPAALLLRRLAPSWMSRSVWHGYTDPKVMAWKKPIYIFAARAAHQVRFS